MPASAEEGRLLMYDWMRTKSPRSVLDIGAGAGTYGRLFRNGLFSPPYLIGIEAWEPYVDVFNLTAVYDYVRVADIREIPLDYWPRADIVILGDVLEHMPEEDAVKVWQKARAVARKAVYLSIPIVPCPQGPEHGNPFEEHVVSDWTTERVLDTFEGITWRWHGQVVGRYEARVS